MTHGVTACSGQFRCRHCCQWIDRRLTRDHFCLVTEYKPKETDLLVAADDDEAPAADTRVMALDIETVT